MSKGKALELRLQGAKRCMISIFSFVILCLTWHGENEFGHGRATKNLGLSGVTQSIVECIIIIFLSRKEIRE